MVEVIGEGFVFRPTTLLRILNLCSLSTAVNIHGWKPGRSTKFSSILVPFFLNCHPCPAISTLAPASFALFVRFPWHINLIFFTLFYSRFIGYIQWYLPSCRGRDCDLNFWVGMRGSCFSMGVEEAQSPLGNLPHIMR